MFCTQCGARIATDSRFCPSCGRPTSADARTSAGASRSAPTEIGPTRPSASQRAALGSPVVHAIIMGILMALVVGGSFYFLSSRRRPVEQAPPAGASRIETPPPSNLVWSGLSSSEVARERTALNAVLVREERAAKQRLADQPAPALPAAAQPASASTPSGPPSQ